jgi:hypothetical protein
MVRSESQSGADMAVIRSRAGPTAVTVNPGIIIRTIFTTASELPSAPACGIGISKDTAAPAFAAIRTPICCSICRSCFAWAALSSGADE